MSRLDDVAQGFINAFFHGKRHVRFIHIGVNDGINSDFVRWRATSFNWSGLLIEPHPNYFKMAIEAYENYEKLIWENIAISDVKETKDLFYVMNVPKEKQWMLGVASFDRERIIKVTGLSGDEIGVHSVNCIPLKEVISKHCFYDIDLMVIDVEGHELNVVKSIDFNLFSVKLVVIETHMNKPVFEEILSIFPENYRGVFSQDAVDSVIYRVT